MVQASWLASAHVRQQLTGTMAVGVSKLILAYTLILGIKATETDSKLLITV